MYKRQYRFDLVIGEYLARKAAARTRPKPLALVGKGRENTSPQGNREERLALIAERAIVAGGQVRLPHGEVASVLAVTAEGYVKLPGWKELFHPVALSAVS